MTTTTLPSITHRIAYDATTRDYACYVQVSGDPEQYIGSAATYHEGELKCVAHKRDLLENDVFTPATTLDGQCGDCGAALDSMGLCGCQAEEPAYTISEPQGCAGLQENCRYYEVVVNGARFRLHNEWPNAIDFQDFSPTRWVGRDLGEDFPTNLPVAARAELRAMWERLFSLPAYAETSPQPDDTLLDAAWRAYRATRGRGDADRVTWGDVVAIQRQFMPRCAAHGAHTAIKHNGNPICAQCIEERGFDPPAMRVAA